MLHIRVSLIATNFRSIDNDFLSLPNGLRAEHSVSNELQDLHAQLDAIENKVRGMMDGMWKTAAQIRATAAGEAPLPPDLLTGIPTGSELTDLPKRLQAEQRRIDALNRTVALRPRAQAERSA